MFFCVAEMNHASNVKYGSYFPSIGDSDNESGLCLQVKFTQRIYFTAEVYAFAYAVQKAKTFVSRVLYSFSIFQ